MEVVVLLRQTNRHEKAEMLWIRVHLEQRSEFRMPWKIFYKSLTVFLKCFDYFIETPTRIYGMQTGSKKHIPASSAMDLSSLITPDCIR